MQTTVAFPVHPAWKTGTPGAMPAFQRLPWKPVELPQNPNLGDGEGKVKAIALGALLLPTAAAAAVSFLGFRAGSRDEEGWVSILGYVVGTLAGVSALMGILAMLGVAVVPLDFSPKTTEVAALPSAPATPAKI
jgi:hypothetical protein